MKKRSMGCSGSRSQEETVGETGNGRPEVNPISHTMKSRLERLMGSEGPEDSLMAFLHLEKIISIEENGSPSSIFGEALSRQRQIKARLKLVTEERNRNELFSEDFSIDDLFADLGLKNSKIAEEHEEFVAKVNRRALNENAIKIWQKSLVSVGEEIEKTSGRIKTLQEAYRKQEELLGKIFGKSNVGGETLEKALEKELDRMRYYKDMFHIGVLQWKTCLENVEKATLLAKEGVAAWKSAKNEMLEKKIKFATAARDLLQEAIILIQSSEELLQDVQFPYCTNRELRVVSQAVEYIFTDILIEERYLYATEIYKNLFQRATLLDGWIKAILDTKMKKDMAEIEEKISVLSKELKRERVNLIKKKLNIKNSLSGFDDGLPTSEPNPSSSGPVSGPESISASVSRNPADVTEYFRNLMEKRKKKIWPSRRIEELSEQ